MPHLSAALEQGIECSSSEDRCMTSVCEMCGWGPTGTNDCVYWR